MPKISVIIPVAPGGSIESALASIKKMNFPKGDFEVIKVEGRTPAKQRNLAAEKAKSEYLYFFDDDARIGAETLNELLKGFDLGAVVVGGPNLTPKTDSITQKAHGEAMSSVFGAAKMRIRYKAEGEMREASETDLILCNLAVRKDIFLKEGGFDERLWPNEENVFFNSLRKKGYKLIYNPSAVIYHGRRGSLIKIANQVFGYGRGRFEQTLIQPYSLQPMFLAPPIFLLYLISLIFYHPAWYVGVLGLYFILDLAFSLKGALKNVKYLLILPWMFPLIHISYGAGFLLGWLFHKQRKGGDIKIKKVKL